MFIGKELDLLFIEILQFELLNYRALVSGAETFNTEYEIVTTIIY